MPRIDATETHSSTTFPRNTTAGKRTKVVEGGRRRQTDVDESAAHAFGWFVCRCQARARLRYRDIIRYKMRDTKKKNSRVLRSVLKFYLNMKP